MSNQGLVSIVIVTWNSADSLAACLDSIQQQTYQSLEVFIVDNASNDESLAIARRYVPDTHIIRNNTNTGFCVAQNQGIRQSTGEFVMPLNPDCILTPDCINHMVEAMHRHPDAGIIAGKLLLTDETSGAAYLDSTGLFMKRQRQQLLRGHAQPDQDQYQAGYIFGADGAAPLYRRAMLEAIVDEGQYFDETFFAHKEDVDLAWRSQMMGWRTWYEPAAVIQHDRTFRPGSRSTRQSMSSQVRLHAVKNRYLTIIKNDFLVNILRDLPAILWYEVKIIGYMLLFERASLRAYGLCWRLLPDMLRRRRAMMRQCRVTPAQIRQAFPPPTP